MKESKDEITEPITNAIINAFSLLNQHTSDVLWIYNLEKREYLYISPSIVGLRGYSVGEAMIQNFDESLHPEDYQYIMTNLPQRIELYEGGDDLMKTLVREVRQPHKNGGMVWVEIATTLVKNAQGKVDIICGISRDITQKKAEIQTLHENQTLFNTVFNFTITGIVLMKEDGTFININEGFCKMLGYPPKYIMKKTFFHFLAEDDVAGVKDVLKLSRNKKRLEKQMEVRFVNLHGKILWGLLNITGIKSHKQNGVNWIIQIHESTARKYSEEIIKNLNADLQDKNREMEQLVYITSHDLRSPLVNIKGFTGELQISMGELIQLIKAHVPPELLDAIEIHEKNIKESFGYIHISIQKMDKLLKGLLEYSRLGKKIRTPEILSMDDLIADVLKTHEYQIKNSGINLDLSSLPTCWGSDDLINQAFSNLIENAIKYLDPSRVGKIKISGLQKGHFSVYCIQDNGIGILPRHHSKIFELFYRLSPENGDGEGLGLSAVKKIMELSGGKIEIESEYENGSKFFVWLPTKEKADIG